MSFENLVPFPAPEKISIKKVDGDTRVPYERIKSYDDKEFELFIREWVVALKIDIKFEVLVVRGIRDVTWLQKMEIITISIISVNTMIIL